MTARRRTGTMEVETVNASARPGDSGWFPSACSATTVHLAVRGSPGRARSMTGSIRSEARPQRALGDEERRRALDARAGQIGHAAGPRERRGIRVVDGEADTAQVARRRRRRSTGVKQPPARRWIARAPRESCRDRQPPVPSIAPNVSALAASCCRSSASTRVSAAWSEMPNRYRVAPQPARPTASAASTPTRTTRTMEVTVIQAIHAIVKLLGPEASS